MTVPARNTESAKHGWDPVWFGLLFLLATVALPFGSNRPWSWSVLSLLASLLLMGWAIMVALGRRPLVWRPAILAPMMMAAAVVAWIIATIIAGVGPANPVWKIASDLLGTALPGRIALSPDAVMVGLMRLLAYGSVFWLVFQYARDRERANMLLVWISWTGLAFAVYGLINYFAGNPYLLWYERWASYDAVSSTFVNRNHYATFAALGMLCAAGVAVTAFRNAWRLSDRSQAVLPRMIECLAGRPLIYFLVTLVIAMAWLQTHSRMGVLAGLCAILSMLGLLMATGMVRMRWMQLLIVLVLSIFLFAVSGQGVSQRLEEKMESTRFDLFSVVVDQIQAAPVTGSGYGSFPAAFRIYRDSRLPSNFIFSEAHNTYLELAAEIGIPATLLLLVAVSWCASLCLIGAFRRRKDRIYPIVAVAATVLVAVHALLDFSLQIPAVATLYAAILGLGLAQSWSVDRES